jgi:DNA-binding CsgD family transcriptional regulator
MLSMRGITLLDRTGKILLVSNRSLHQRVAGTSVWSWIDARDLADFKLAIANFQFEQRAVAYCVRTLKLDGFLFSGVVEHVGDLFVAHWQRRLASAPELTPRERQVLVALCRDETIKQTARRLRISVKTVESFRLILRKKIGARSSAGLIVWAVANGIVDADE